MEAIVFILVKIVGLCAVGYILRSRDIVTVDFSKQLTSFLISVVTPFAILSSGSLQYSEKIASDLLTTVFFMLGYFVVTIGLMTLGSLFIHADRKMKGVFINLSIFASVTFIGFPVVNQIYAAEGTLIIVTANLVFNLFLYSYGVNNFNSKQGFSIKGLLKSPLIFASLLSLGLFFAPFSLPDSLWGAISTIGGLMTPLALLSIGFWVAEIPIRQIFMNPRSYIVALLKLMIFPLAMLVITRQLGVTPLVSNVLTIITAIPSATLNVVFAKRYHCGDEFAVQTVVLTNVLMMISLPLLLLLIL